MIDGGAEFAALRLANEGGTHGPVGTYVVTGRPSTYPLRALDRVETFQELLPLPWTATAGPDSAG